MVHTFCFIIQLNLLTYILHKFNNRPRFLSLIQPLDHIRVDAIALGGIEIIAGKSGADELIGFPTYKNT